MLTDEQKRELRVKVAELCGWREHEHERGDGMIVIRWRLNGKYQIDVEPPNYPEDLNAMHEIEPEYISGDKNAYWSCLSEIICGVRHPDLSKAQWVKVAHATATQRAMAFVKVMEGES